VAGIEARGLILGGAVALPLGAGFAPVRKRGKLPWQTIGEDYALEYGTDRVEMHRDALSHGERVLLVDDLVATGGTAEAAIRVITKLGGEIVGCACIIDLPDLGSRRSPRSDTVSCRSSNSKASSRGAPMKVQGVAQRTIRVAAGGRAVEIIDQTRLPFELRILRLERLEDAAEAIAQMRVRGAPLIGATAAYGLCLALREDASDAAIERACRRLLATRPTAVNLAWALGDAKAALAGATACAAAPRAWARAAACETMRPARDRRARGGCSGAGGAAAAGRELLTHCNAGWLATVDWGTALAPVYVAAERGILIHVWVSETRPRNQGASLTAWELGQHGVPHTVVADSAGGHLLQRGCVDLVLTGSDRTTATGDVCNKIGTYPKALAARDNRIPFYVALPHSTIDWGLTDGVAQIPIEERAESELRVWGARDGERARSRSA
jgi:methylthioribose-1-phosphate isomerase